MGDSTSWPWRVKVINSPMSAGGSVKTTGWCSGMSFFTRFSSGNSKPFPNSPVVQIDNLGFTEWIPRTFYLSTIPQMYQTHGSGVDLWFRKKFPLNLVVNKNSEGFHAKWIYHRFFKIGKLKMVEKDGV